MHVTSLGTDQNDQTETGTTTDILLTCQARGRLKKERVAIVTGDRVELDELDLTEKSAIITTILERRSLIARPSLANVDQVVIVQAVKQPQWNPLWTDRYIVHFQLTLPVSRPILCFNKADLGAKNDLDHLRSIYEPLGYFVIFVSAKTSSGLSELASLLAGKISVFAGPSGVGKSTMLNKLCPGLNLKTGLMENDFGVGRHTTTYSELYRLNLNLSDAPEGSNDLKIVASSEPTEQTDQISWIADTPGFNLIEFLHPEPRDVAAQFPEIDELGLQCRFADCLHLVEAGCAVLDSLSDLLGDAEEEDEADAEEEDEAEDVADREECEVAEIDRPVSLTRYESYLIMVTESQAEQALQKTTSKKIESSVKAAGGANAKTKFIPRLANKYRQASRNTVKQKAIDTASFDDDLDKSKTTEE